jgi:hypothetical protein
MKKLISLMMVLIAVSRRAQDWHNDPQVEQWVA